MRGSRIAGTAALLLMLGGGALPAAAASADTGVLYVGTTGCSDTSATAGTQATPYCTIQAAVDVVQPGQTVRVEPGQYHSEVDITRSGTAADPITIEGMGGDLGDPRAVVIGSAHGFVLDGVQNVVVRDLQATTTAEAVVVTDSSAVTLDENRFFPFLDQRTSPTTGIALLGQTHDVTISRNWISGYGTDAISLGSGTADDTVTTNALDGTAGTGIAVTGATGTVLTGNTVVQQNCRPGIVLSGGSTGGSLRNNAVTHPGGPATDCSSTTPPQIEVAADSTAQTSVDYTLVNPVSGFPAYSWAGSDYATPTELHDATGQGAHDLAGPFTFAPQEGAASIDSADANAPGELSTDIWGKPRVDDPVVTDTGTGPGTFDRGAVEFQDPVSGGQVTLNYAQAPAGTAITATASPYNPWSDAISAYTFAFGDGSAAIVSPTPSATHTYSRTGSFSVVVTPEPADGAAAQATGAAFLSTVNQPLQSYSEVNPPQPTTPLTVLADTRDTVSAWKYTITLDFGDGSGPETWDTGGLYPHTYPRPGNYTVTEQVSDADGASLTKHFPVSVGSAFVPVTPARILDTRSTAKVGPGGTVSVQVTGVDGIPADGVTAVVLNVTATDATTGTFVTAYADGAGRPTASNLNIAAGGTVPAMVTVPVGPDGKVTLYNHSGSLDLIADAEGYYRAAASVPGGTLLKSAQQRILDTRSGTGAPKAKVGAGQTVTFTLPSWLTQDTAVKAVLVNVTATDATAGTYIAAYPAGSARPATSVLNVTAGRTVANLVTVPVSAGNQVTLYNHSGSVDLVADLQAAYSGEGSGLLFFPVAPTRVLDTRLGLGAPKAALGPGQTVKLSMAPAEWGVMVLLNLTVTDTTASSFLTAYPDGQALPNVSNLNFTAGQTLANAAVVGTGNSGAVDIWNHSGSTDVVADAQGYFAY